MKERTPKKPNWDRVEGILTKEGRELLSRKNVAIIGVGSLGSEITRLLTMAGVGNFVLVDPDKLDESNVLRHWADLRDVGKFKVTAVKKLIKQRNPDVQVKTFPQDARINPCIFPGLDLAIITGLGSNDAQFQIAENTKQVGITTLATAIYNKGQGGEVFVVKPNEGPCYACFSTYLNRSINAEVRNGKIYCANVNPEQVPSFPALAVQINRIATIAAEYAIELLKDSVTLKNSEKNLLIFSNTKLLLGKSAKDGHEIYLDPLRAVSYHIPKYPDCLVCGSYNILSDLTIEELLTQKGGD